mgnify:CR=1 FL=1
MKARPRKTKSAPLAKARATSKKKAEEKASRRAFFALQNKMDSE